MELEQIEPLAKRIQTNVSRVIVGKEDMVECLLIAMIAQGHVLLEDVPGTGKTMLAKALAKSIDCTTRRVQFTPDLLPSDLTGINFFNQKSGEFEFRQGPVFTNILLSDEINRATPRTQSSLLECMEERQVTIDGETRMLAEPFLVIATQNPVENQGTFPLPEAQLDRFLLKLQMGYPSHEEGLSILRRFQSVNPLAELEAVATGDDIAEAGKAYSAVTISDDVLHYLLTIVESTRSHSDVILGVSPRGSQALLKAVQVRAVLRGRSFVTPDDVKAMAVPVLAHRIAVRYGGHGGTDGAATILQQILSSVSVPTESFELAKES